MIIHVPKSGVVSRVKIGGYFTGAQKVSVQLQVASDGCPD